MAALGINVTTNERTYGWESIRPPKRTPLEVALIEAREYANYKWAEYNNLVDYLEKIAYRADEEEIAIVRAELSVKLEDAEDADKAVIKLYNQINCPHEEIDFEGGEYQSGGEREDNIRPVCRKCGTVVNLLFEDKIRGE